jgi:hypothetical protein
VAALVAEALSVATLGAISGMAMAALYLMGGA